VIVVTALWLTRAGVGVLIVLTVPVTSSRGLGVIRGRVRIPPSGKHKPGQCAGGGGGAATNAVRVAAHDPGQPGGGVREQRPTVGQGKTVDVRVSMNARANLEVINEAAASIRGRRELEDGR
jgi:hypothetical protein